ncbi:hypothetical protein V8E36_004414 [Tilletia maclaganii]
MSQVQSSSTPPRSTHASYHPDGYGVSEGLKRARRPYFWKNAITGGAILAFATGVYYYSISKVKQMPADLAADKATSQAKSAANSLSSSLYSASDRVANAANTAANKTSRSLHNAQASLEDLSSSAQASLHKFSSDTQANLARLAEQARDAGAHARDSAVEAGHEASEVVRRNVNLRVPAALEPKDDGRNRLRELILIAQGRPL